MTFRSLLLITKSEEWKSGKRFLNAFPSTRFFCNCFKKDKKNFVGMIAFLCVLVASFCYYLEAGVCRKFLSISSIVLGIWTQSVGVQFDNSFFGWIRMCQKRPNLCVCNELYIENEKWYIYTPYVYVKCQFQSDINNDTKSILSK